MRAFQVARAHQEFAHDFGAGEFEGTAEQLHPISQRLRMVAVEPIFERTECLLQLQNLLRIVDGGIDFQAIADHFRVGQQALAVGFAEGGHGGDVKAGVGGAQAGGTLQNQRPAQASLVDFEQQAAEEFVVVFDGEAVEMVVIMLVGIGAVGGQAVGKGAVAVHAASFSGRQTRASR